jgi:hypothetical protein
MSLNLASDVYGRLAKLDETSIDIINFREGLIRRHLGKMDWLRIIYIGNVKRDNACDNASNSDTYLLTLANTNDPICVTSSKVAKASTISVSVASIITGIFALTFDNVNNALMADTAQGCFKYNNFAYCLPFL